MNNDLVFGVSDFVAYLNQTLEIAYPYVTVEGELSNFRVSKNRWVYFDLKDEAATVRCFSTVYALPGPLEDGMRLKVSGSPRLHPLYNFSLNVQTIVPVGEGTIKKAAELLAAKLEAEGLFDAERKRSLPYPPQRVALVTAGSSAAYADFIKITNARWRGMSIEHYDVLVQGEHAPTQIAQAIAAVNNLAEPPDVLVVIRGGGSADDLAAFSTERVTRAVASSRVPTLVAIGHEIDISLAELAADQRASTPSNAAELLTPDRQISLAAVYDAKVLLQQQLEQVVTRKQVWLDGMRTELGTLWSRAFSYAGHRLVSARQLLEAYNPQLALERGYALVRKQDTVVRSAEEVITGDLISIELAKGILVAEVRQVQEKGV